MSLTSAARGEDVTMTGATSPSQQKKEDEEPKYGGFTRFEIELEFVQCLANPHYLLHLATLSTTPTEITPSKSTPATAPTATTSSSSSITIPLLTHPPFLAYLSYLRYFSQPPYIAYLTYPGPTLKNLELLQNERFRREVLSPEVVARLVREGMVASVGL